MKPTHTQQKQLPWYVRIFDFKFFNKLIFNQQHRQFMFNEDDCHIV